MTDQDGNTVSLADQAGNWVLLWWYPKAATPGWTIQGQALRDSAADFADAGCRIFGASFDTPAENKAFKDAQGFQYPLLSDPGKVAGAAYEVVRAADHPYANFPERFSYLIDADGVIRKTYNVSDVGGHAAEVLKDLAELKAS
jgi:thioredoxin-dependent peroxiredoxin